MININRLYIIIVLNCVGVNQNCKEDMSKIEDLWFFSKRKVSSSLTIILATHEPSILLKWFQGLTCFMVTFPAFNPRVSPFAFSLAWLPLFPLYDMLPSMSHLSSYSDSKVGQTTRVYFLAFNPRVSSRPFTWCPLHGSLPLFQRSFAIDEPCLKSVILAECDCGRYSSICSVFSCVCSYTSNSLHSSSRLTAQFCQFDGSLFLALVYQYSLISLLQESDPYLSYYFLSGKHLPFLLPCSWYLWSIPCNRSAGILVCIFSSNLIFSLVLLLALD